MRATAPSKAGYLRPERTVKSARTILPVGLLQLDENATPVKDPERQEAEDHEKQGKQE